MQFNGQVAVVTGGSDGIGKGIALAFAEAGASVVIAARRPDKLAETQAEIEATGAQVLAVPTDVTDAASVQRLADEMIQRFGRVDVLVNNAGGSFGPTFARGPLLDLTESDFTECFRVNVTSVFLCCKAFVPLMQAQGRGVVVNTGSILAGELRKPAAPFGVYSSAKAALARLTRAMALEWAPAVRVVTLAAGDIDTPRVTASRSPAEIEASKATIAMGRLGTPADIASLVLFLASDSASWVTGANVDINGGE